MSRDVLSFDVDSVKKNDVLRRFLVLGLIAHAVVFHMGTRFPLIEWLEAPENMQKYFRILDPGFWDTDGILSIFLKNLFG